MKKRRARSVLKLNTERLISMITFGKVASVIRYDSFEHGHQGKLSMVPLLGGIVIDYDLGDPVDKYESDHLQPGMTISSDGTCDDPEGDFNKALMSLTCVGNTVTITDPDSRVLGKKGVIIGKHGGVNYLMARFDKKVLKKIGWDEYVRIEMYGQGLKCLNYKDLTFCNIDPNIVKKIPILKKGKDKVSFPVVKNVPPEAMGSGLGSIQNYSDYDIQENCIEASKGLKIGDFVCIQDYKLKVGLSIHKGAKVIGIVVHGSCLESGHGPGILPIISCETDQLTTHIDPKSNLKRYVT